MWTYEQSTGRLLHDGQYITTGYSGAGSGKNNTAMEQVPNVGPIPRGRWMFGAMHDSNAHGPDVLPLFPCGVDTKRSEFLIHGDKIGAPGTASKGCIILPLKTRIKMDESGDRLLEVVS